MKIENVLKKAVELSYARGNAKEIAEEWGISPDLLYRWACMVVMIWAGLPMLLAQEEEGESGDSASMVFELGEVQVTGTRGDPFVPVLRLDEMESLQQADAASAVSFLPGVHFMLQGPRNDGMVSVRGFDLRQVPVYVDGVPVYVSYDGYTDLSRFLLTDLSKISVTRGETSVLLGSNNLGGAINLVTRKPAGELELDAEGGIYLDRSGWGGWRSSVNLGTKREKFFVQLGAGTVQRAPFSLSAQTDEHGRESSGVRENSQYQDLQTSVKFGFTPSGRDSYVISYHYQDGSKGVPVYTGQDPNQRVRYWRFPAITKQGIHFNSRTTLGRKTSLQARLYYDDYFSDLRSYDDSTYSSQEFGRSFTSIYDDETLGGSLIISTGIDDRHDIRTALLAVYDHHTERNTLPVVEPLRHFSDITLSMGVEDRIKLSGKLSAVLGVSAHYRDNLQADNYDPGSGSITGFTDHADWTPNMLAGLRYTPSERHTMRVNLSRKTRFPTMKDRYSYRLGRSIPNTDLEPEASWNSDLSYMYRHEKELTIRTSLYYSRLERTIQEVYGIDPDNSAVYQFQNTGDSRFYGWELDVAWEPVAFIRTGAQYTLIIRENLTRPELIFTDVPRHKLFGFAEVTPFPRLHVRVSGLYNSSRVSTTDGVYLADPFFRMDLSTSFTLFQALSLRGSVENLWDTPFSYAEGYPAPGRTFYLGLRVSFR